ncbi:hypothetical protein OG21DRAFT_748890 [Imleria badia]|nr:hypothetical protein OG21DRAFT_748890 [Imleria badia]
MVTTVAMILRVWAMYNRERRILRTLLTLFSIKIIFTVFAAAFEPRNLSDSM